MVHNANLLAALVLCEAAELCEEEAWVDEALRLRPVHGRATGRATARGRTPKSRYGRWVDGFHTGFVLEGLARVVARDRRRRPLARRSASAASAFYVAQLFGPDGEPKYYPDRAYPSTP